MRRRVTLATAIAGAVLALLAACGSDASDGTGGDQTKPSATAAPTSATPSTGSQDPAAAALVGDWEIAAEDYVLHLVEDGTFVQDYMGVIDFRTGTYTVDGDTISLVGGDGDTDEGKIVGDTLEFELGTATRLE